MSPRQDAVARAARLAAKRRMWAYEDVKRAREYGFATQPVGRLKVSSNWRSDLVTVGLVAFVVVLLAVVATN
jgi:hypothetical protein